MDGKKIIIAGSRRFNDFHYLEKEVMNVIGKEKKVSCIISGTAQGADSLGEKFAHKYQIPVKRFPANWNCYGKKAGILRNRQMAQYASNNGILIAFWDGQSPGTKNMIEISKDMGLKVYIFPMQSPEDHNVKDLFNSAFFIKKMLDQKGLTPKDDELFVILMRYISVPNYLEHLKNLYDFFKKYENFISDQKNITEEILNQMIEESSKLHKTSLMSSEEKNFLFDVLNFFITATQKGE